ncbi:hypothetical protein HPC49_32645 [Pyxidicoccus fallax]|uniref:Uncharacterized protein n=1 Tax=Pyxidicoccus fallax TaxID=394095 RepID=A0A848L6Y0_9BACT|nr:hypothetical protein [Pyxidicoccus fallax]NMO14499.1 hypothetical protein [Pyxidicoccus fallax]NPC82960.1 hypothetical protein [Pyxidicoccus fallax]
MTEQEATKVLTDAELVPCAEMQLMDARRLVEACLGADVPALVHREACGKMGCSPKFQVLVRPEDGPRVAAILQQRWADSLEREGLLPQGAMRQAAAAPSEDGEPPCPACGTAAPLVAGACADCGLQLE